MSRQLRLHNTYTRQLETFTPLKAPDVMLYSCGPTVYSYAHIGNFRSFLFSDVLRRFLERLGHRVRHVMNITDVGHMTEDHLADCAGEDKLARAARELGWDPYKVAAHYEQAFAEDAKLLRLKAYLGEEAEEATQHPRATEYVGDMLVMIQRLLEKGYAYTDQLGQVYFSVEKFPPYGALSGKRLEDLEAGARVEVRNEKRDPRDFALWKVDEKHLMQWDPHSENGWQSDGYARFRARLPEGGMDTRVKKGFPGWHIECSAMARSCLGEQIDIHTGGEDNIFPHHECEIAQSFGASEDPEPPASFTRYWLHGRHLLVDGAKMSKSTGTFFTARDLIDPIKAGRPDLSERLREAGFAEGKVPPNVLRYALISTAYTQPLNFTFALLVQARSSLERLTSLYLRVSEAAGAGKVNKALGKTLRACEADFDEAMCDNLNASRALAALFNCVSAVNRETDLSPADAGAVRDLLDSANQVLDVLDTRFHVATLTDAQLDALAERAREADVDALVHAQGEAALCTLLARRRLARRERDFETSDRIRDALLARGVQVQDLPSAVRYRYEQKPD